MDFINGFVSDALPLAPSTTAKSGVSQAAAREDHVHPTTVPETALADYVTETELETALADYAAVEDTVFGFRISLAVESWTDEGTPWGLVITKALPTGAHVLQVEPVIDSKIAYDAAGVAFVSWLGSSLTFTAITSKPDAPLGAYVTYVIE